MTDNGIERAEKAVEALVYGTVGLALYVRDTAPSFFKLFVARGKSELGNQGKSVGDQIGQVRNLGNLGNNLGNNLANLGNLSDQISQVRSLGDLAVQQAPQVLRAVSDQVAWLRERAEDVIAGFGPPAEGETPPPYSPAPAPEAPAAPAPPASAAATPNAPSTPKVPSAPTAPTAPSAPSEPGSEAGDGQPTSWRSDAGAGAPAAAAPASGLAITDYDELSASQVVDRLEGLPRHELEAIRDYERAHRARNTILGKIDQLTR